MNKQEIYKNIKTISAILGLFLIAFVLFKIAPEYRGNIIVKDFNIKQNSSLPGEPIKWIKTVSISEINKYKRLIEVPKIADNIKVSTLAGQATTVSNTKIQSSLTNADRIKLSELSKERSTSEASLALAEVIKAQKAKGFFASVNRVFSKVGSMFATVDESSVEPEMVTVDVLPIIEIPEEIVPTVEEETSYTAEEIIIPTLGGQDAGSGQAEEQATSTEESIIEEVITTEETISTSTETINVSTEEIISTSTEVTIVEEIISTNTEEQQTQSSSDGSSSNEEETESTSTPIVVEEQSTSTATTTDLVAVEYETPAPTIAEAVTDTGKVVSISSEDSEVPVTNVLAFTNIPEIYKVGQEDKIQIKWSNNNDKNVIFKAYDLNNNRKLDYVEWTVPHLSTQIFEIIFISKAFQLDANKEIIADIYDIVKTQDGNYAPISDGQYVRVTFEKILTDKNDITIYARPVNTPVTIEAYTTDTNQLVATFNITEEGLYKELIPELDTPTDLFDLKIIGEVEIDYVVDPTGLILHYTMDDNSASTDVLDSSGNNYTGTATANTDTLTTTGVISSAINLSSSNYVTLPSPIVFGENGAINLWVENYAEGMILMGGTGAGGGVDRYLYWYTDGNIYIGSNTFPEQVNWSSSGINFSGWHMISIVKTGTTVELFIDTVSQGTGTLSTLSDITEIGRGINTVPDYNYSNTKIDDFRVYDTTLSQTEIETLYTDGGGSVTSLVAHYTMDDTDGTTVTDSSGNNYNGTGTYTPATGVIDGAMSFNGMSDYINLGSSIDLTNTAFTYSAWVYPTATNKIVISGDYGAPSMVIDTSGAIGFSELGEGSGAYVGSDIMSLNAWHHIVVVYDSSNNIISYLDGQPNSMGSSNFDFPFVLGNLYIGTYDYFGTKDAYFNGYIDDVRIYNGALTQSEIDALYAGGTPPVECKTVTTDGDYTVETFRCNETFSIDRNINAEVLVVAGGGGGSQGNGGGSGGGAGGLLYNSSYSISSGDNSVVVGAGGAGGESYPGCDEIANGKNGGNSSFDSLIAVGGGGGVSCDVGKDGGSGGGSSGNNSPFNGGVGVFGQGNNGGAGDYSWGAYGGGGGGGAGGIGQNGTYEYGGNGGDGLQYSISGTPTYYAAGGGGGVNDYSYTTGTGGSGIGGNGSYGEGVDAVINTGSGGGGGGSALAKGGDGSSGIVIIRYLTNAVPLDTTNPTITVTSPTNNTTYSTTSINFDVSATDETSLGFIVPDLDSSLVSWWRMDDIDGSTLTDYVGNNDGTISGTSQTTGKFGDAMSFNGSSFVNIGNPENLQLQTFTALAWIKPNAQDYGFIFSHAPTGSSGWGMVYGTLWIPGESGNHYLHFDDAWVSDVLRYDIDLHDGNYHQVGIYRDIENNVGLIIDGQVVNTGTYSGVFSFDDFYIGSRDENDSFSGLIDDTMIFNRALTLDEIVSLYNGTAIDYTSILTEGSHTYKAFAQDLAGNVASSSLSSFGITLPDIISPIITVTSPTNNTTYSTTSINFDVSATDETSLGFIVPDLDSSLISWWRMDDVDGTTLTDYMGNNNGNISGASQTTGKFGDAMSFNGVDNYISIPYDSAFNVGSNNFTFSTWFYPTSDAKQAIFASDTDCKIGAVYSMPAGPKKLNIFAGSGSGCWNLITADGGGNGIGTITLEPNNWYHIIYQREGSTFRTYINGVLDLQLNVSGSIVSRNEPFVIGRWGAGGDRMWNSGKIDEFLFFNRSLSIDEIGALYNGSSINHTSVLDLVPHTYKTYASDISGNISSSTLNNFSIECERITTDGDYTVHTFICDKTFTIDRNIDAEVLVVAGGGGGGKAEPNTFGDGAGGGGAGGLIYYNSYNINTGDYSITVGTGGLGSTANTTKGSSGTNSSFDSLIAIGGGGGGSDNHDLTGVNLGANGGSGGGSASMHTDTVPKSSGTSGQGNDGSSSIFLGRRGGGGGGAGTASVLSSNGGSGLSYSISGTPTYYAGGGGGGAGEFTDTVGLGGSGVGGSGGIRGSAGSNAVEYTGSGGGGGGTNNNNGIGGNGSRGVVIIRYITNPDNTAPTGGSITYTNGYATSPTITYTLGTDDISGINNSSGKIQRAEATLSNNVCSSFTSFSDLVTEYDGSYTDTSVVEGNCYKYQYLISDNIGNTATYTSANVLKVDTTIPTTSDNYTTNNIWQTTNQTITLTPTDLGGSGLSSTKYCIDTNNTCVVSSGTNYTVPVNTFPEGINYFRYASVDNAGNIQTTISKIVKIDTTNPSVDIGINKIRNSIYTQTSTTSDVVSGIASYLWSSDANIIFGATTSSSTAITAATDGTHIIRLTVTDNAGNSTYDEYTLIWDTTFPIVSSISPVEGTTISRTNQPIIFTISENGDCRLSTENKSYDDMSTDVSCTSNSLLISCTLPNFTSSGIKDIYIACNDSYDNKDTASTTTYVSYRVRSSGGGIITTTEYSTNVESIFNIQTSNRTDSRIVTLNITPNIDTKLIVISNNPDFNGAITIPVQTTYDYNLCQTNTTCPDGDYTIYARSLDIAGIALPVVSTTVTLSTESIIEKITDIIDSIIPTSTPEVILPPVSVSEEDQDNFNNNIGEIIPSELTDLSYNNLPTTFKNIIKLFPDITANLQKINITAIDNNLSIGKVLLPGISEYFGLSLNNVLISNFTSEQSKKLPSDLVFARTSDESIDLNVKLSVSNEGLTTQTLSTIQGQTIKFVIKPEEKAKRVDGYLMFKAPYINQTASVLEATEEQELVVNKFDYKDNGNGVWTAEVVSPYTIGQYELKTVISFEDKTKAQRELSMIVLVDPEGYVYEKNGKKETRIENANVSIYWLNKETKNYELWPADNFKQINPQITDVTGRYSFLVPTGDYYITVKTDGYNDYQSESFKVEESKGVFMNIEMKEKFVFINLVNLQNILLSLITIILVYFLTISIIRRGKKIN